MRRQAIRQRPCRTLDNGFSELHSTAIGALSFLYIVPSVVEQDAVPVPGQVVVAGAGDVPEQGDLKDHLLAHRRMQVQGRPLEAVDEQFAAGVQETWEVMSGPRFWRGGEME